MLWNTAIGLTLVNTCLVSGGAALVAVGFGWLLAVLVTCLKIPFGRTLTLCMLGMSLVPIYVHATAWSAGFGVQGWLRLSQVAAAISPARAMMSVIWVHGITAAPLCFMLGKVGLARAMNSSARQAILEFGAGYAIRNVLLWNALPWVAASFLWTVATTANDMVVTNLYQVPTLAEAMYQQVQFNEIRASSIVANCLFAFTIGVFSAVGFNSLANDLGTEEQHNASIWNALRFSNSVRAFGACIAFGIVFLVAIFPLLNLGIRAGWKTHVIDGRLVSNWSWKDAAQALIQLGGFQTEIAWSFQVATCASLLAITISGLLIWGMHSLFRLQRPEQFNATSNQVNAFAIGCMVFLLALPGPLVNLLVLRLLSISNSAWLAYISDRTLVGPVIALQFRCLPIAFGILWLTKERFYRRHKMELQLDAGQSLLIRAWIWGFGMKVPIVFALSIAFVIAFADLATYLLVLPAGVTTVAMRMFDLLHYGVKNQEAALALILFIMSFFVIGFLLLVESQARRT